MPSINGITASIETHDGTLPELGHGEFSGGKSCYIPAQSGQQFWLHYIIHRSIPCEALSVEFYVDGQRVDAQFSVPRRFINNQTVGPVDSTIKSQYGRGTGDGGSEVAWRREIFFTLIRASDFPKGRCTTWPPSESVLSAYGTIDCKVFRSERSPEWAGAVTPDEFCDPSAIIKSLKGRNISHVARLGVRMEAQSAKRFCVKSLDPDDAPFAWFKFYYRSRSCLVEKFKLRSFPEILPLGKGQGIGSRSLLQSQYTGIKPTKRNPLVHFGDNVEPQAWAPCVAETNEETGSLDDMIQRLEHELSAVKVGGPEQKDKIISCYKKINKLRNNSEKLRATSIQLQEKSG